MLEAALKNSGTGAEGTQKSFVGYKSNLGNKNFILETEAVATKPSVAAAPHNEQIDPSFLVRLT